jgi:hydrogenase maturation protease
MIENNPKKVLLIGIGNEYRGDDRIGLEVARQIREKQIPFVVVKEESGEGAALMEAWKGCKSVIIVDAISSGAKPGTIFEIDARKNVPLKFFHYSTHAFSVAEAIELARAMGTLPQELLIYGIEGTDFSAGVSMSHVVQESAKQVVNKILKQVKAIN